MKMVAKLMKCLRRIQKVIKQTYSDMTKENEGVRETMMAPIKKVKKMFSKEGKKSRT
jgi:siroheme synthase (precorrin-2 oxidase/ferrochelatase)